MPPCLFDYVPCLFPCNKHNINVCSHKVKPVQLAKQVLQGAYKHALLIDNDLEKSLGFSQKYVNNVPVSNKNSKFSNLDEEHIELKPFRGDKNDNELDPVCGGGAREVFKRIHELQQKYNLFSNCVRV